MDCPGCGRTNPEGAVECTRCGGRLFPRSDHPAEAPVGGLDPSEAPTVAEDARQDAPTQADIGGTSGASGTSAPSLEVGQSIGDRYEILSVLGEGGCGVVYKAHDRALDRTVAIKTIHPSVAGNPKALERFKREILLASKITHRNVVRIHDLGESGDLKFISMAFIEGTDLKEVILDKGPMPVDRALEVIGQIGEALQAAHEAGVVHRDLKPRNVLVDASGRAYIADFGISRSIDHGQTMTEAGAVVGTVAYMSPEQARGETADHRSDIYSLGLILYEMLSGAQPFESSNPLSQLMKRVEREVPSVDVTRSDLPAWLVRIVARCAARDVEDRYQSVAELLADLEHQRATVVRRRLAVGRLGRIAAGIGVSAAALGAGAWWWTHRPPPAAPTVRASVMVLPFRNVSNDPRDEWTRAGLPDLLRSELRQSPDLRLAGKERATDLLEGMKLASDDYDESSLVTLARLAGVESLLTGDVIRVGDRFRVEARLVRTGASRVASQVRLRAEGQGEGSLFAIVDELSAGVRSELGLGRSWRGRRKVAELSTGSVEALRLYTESVGLAREGADLQAVSRLESALEVDPDFWLARALLAELYAGLGRGDQALVEADLAAAGLSAASPHEAARIRAVRAVMSDDVETALLEYEELVRLAPNRPDAHMARASLQEDVGELEGALRSLDRALELDPKNPAALYTRGRVKAKLGDLAAAIEDFNAALANHVEAGNQQGRATVLLGLGNVHRILGEPERALDYYSESLSIRRDIGDERGVAAALNNIALIQEHLGLYEAAIQSQQESLAVYRELQDPRGEAEACANLGDLYANLGQAEQALQHYQDGLRLLRGESDEAGLARAMANMGFIYQVLGRYDEAFVMLHESLQKRRELDEIGDLLMSLVDMGNLELVQGRFDQALEHYHEAMGLARETGDQDILIASQINLALVHHERGEHGGALAAASEAQALASETGNAIFRALSFATLGGTRLAIGDLDGADAALEQALALADEAGNLSVVAETLTHRGYLLLARGRREQAVREMRRAVETAREAQEHRLVLRARMGAAWAEGSVSGLIGVREEADSNGLPPLRSRADLLLARLRIEQGRPRDGASAAEQAVALAQELGQRDVLLQAHWAASRAFEALGQSEAALLHARDGLDSLEAMLRGLGGSAAIHFRERPETQGFARDVEGLLPPPDLERLRSALAPQEPPPSG